MFKENKENTTRKHKFNVLNLFREIRKLVEKLMTVDYLLNAFNENREDTSMTSSVINT